MGYEYQVSVGGIMYGMTEIQSVSITRPLFDKLSVGNACAAELAMSFWPREEPPRMAEIIAYEREDAEHEWTKLGTFYIDTRTKKNGLLSVVAYDAMLRAEDYWPEGTYTFPMLMTDAVDIILAETETEVDPRTHLEPGYTITQPLASESMRNVLGYIAAANGGNWIVTNEGKLLLIPLLGSMPPETHYLIDENGSALLFGSTRILI